MSGIVQRLKSATAYERALYLAILAIGSALLSWSLPEPDIVFLDKTPMLPALWFGLVMCAGMALWSSHSLPALAVVLVASGAAWFAAFETTIHVHGTIEDQIVAQSGAPVPNFTTPVADYLYGLCGMLGGLVGGGVLVLILSTVASGVRSAPSWTRTMLVATVAGLFLEPMASRAEGGWFIHTGSVLPVLLVWQMSVAASLAYSFAKPAARPVSSLNAAA